MGMVCVYTASHIAGKKVRDWIPFIAILGIVARLAWEVHSDGTQTASVEAVPPQEIEPTDSLVAFVRP